MRASTVALRDVCALQTGVRNPARSADERFQYVDISAVDNVGKRITAAQTLLGKNAPSRARNRILAGDVLVSTTRPNLNAVAMVPDDLNEQICSTGFCVLRAGPRVLPTYLFHFVQSPTFVEPLSDLVKGALYPAVNDSQVLDQRIPLPPLDEQQQIATNLTRALCAANAARRAAEDGLAAAEALPTACLREVFEGNKWIVRELRELCRTITDGTHLPPPFTDSGVPFLFVRNIVSGAIDFDVQKYISEETYNELTKKHKAEPGDVLFSAVGSFGVAAVVRTDTRFAFQRHIAHIKPDTTLLDADFLGYFLNSPDGRSQSEAVAMGGAQRTVTLADLRRFRIPVPPLAEQRRIAADLSRRLQAAESVIARCREELATIKAFPASLLRAAFNGDS